MALNFEVGSIVSGKVVKIKPFGAIVSLDNNVQGLVHISQISSSFVQNINSHLNVGDVVKVKILSVDIKSNKVALSIKEVDNDAKQSKQVKQNKQFKQNKYSHHNATNDQSHVSNNDSFSRSYESNPSSSLDDKIKEWTKQSNERQAGLSKRNNRR